MTPSNLRAPLALLVAATTWGLVWYPYRLIEAHGVSGVMASLLTYGLAALMLWGVYRGRLSAPAGTRRALAVVALAAGWTNLAYVLAVLDGEIMRVMLLFYLAPLWTVLFARVLLGERPNLWAYLVVLLSLAGAVSMLAGAAGAPLPRNAAEWLAVSAGVGFALSNVLSRRLGAVPAETRAVWIFVGVLLVSLPLLASAPQAVPLPDARLAGLLLLTAGLLVLATLTVQFGLAHLPANRAIVILLIELVVAALASHLLTGERMAGREWLGAALIMTASLLSAKVEEAGHA